MSYRQIRRKESLQLASKMNGRRLRGVTLSPDLCLGRDREFYRMENGLAWRLDPADVLAQYDLPTLRALFNRAEQHATISRRDLVAVNQS